MINIDNAFMVPLVLASVSAKVGFRDSDAWVATAISLVAGVLMAMSSFYQGFLFDLAQAAFPAGSLHTNFGVRITPIFPIVYLAMGGRDVFSAFFGGFLSSLVPDVVGYYVAVPPGGVPLKLVLCGGGLTDGLIIHPLAAALGTRLFKTLSPKLSVWGKRV